MERKMHGREVSESAIDGWVEEAEAGYDLEELNARIVIDLSGAAGHDLPTGDALLVVASLQGYLNALTAVLFLGGCSSPADGSCRAIATPSTVAEARRGPAWSSPGVVFFAHRRDYVPMLPEERFNALVEEFAAGPGVSVPGEPGRRGFGSSALKVNGSIFAMISGGKLVVKLPHARVLTLIVAGTGMPFDAGKGRPMKEWLTVAVDDLECWLALAREALDFVGSAHH